MKILDPELGLMKQCYRCKEWWPADEEFFFRASNRKDGLHSYCKDCYIQYKYPNGRGNYKVPMHSEWEYIVGDAVHELPRDRTALQTG